MIATAHGALLLGVPDQGISILWPPTALLLGYCILRGPIALPGAVLGIIVWAFLLQGASLASTALVAAATALPPWMCAAIVRTRLAGRRVDLSLRTTVELMVLVALVTAPVATLLGATSMSDHPMARGNFMAFAAGYYLVELTSCLVFGPLGYIWAQTVCLLSSETPAGSRPQFQRLLDWPSLAFLAGIAMVCLWLHRDGMSGAARWLIFAAVFGPLFSSLSRGPRVSSTVLAVAALLMLGLRTHFYGNSPEIAITEGLMPGWLLISVGAIFLHLLNALSFERHEQARRLEASALESEIAGLASPRALHRLLAQLTRGSVTKPFRVIEIFIPEVLRVGELLGRTAMLELETAAAARLNEQAGRRAALTVHLSTGRFAMITSPTVADARVLQMVQGALQGQSFKISGRLFQLRPSIGLIDVPVSAKTHPEAVLAALSMAQQQAYTSAERFQRYSIGSRELKQLWSELDLEEDVKRALHEKRIRLVGQLIAPCQRGSESIGLHFEVLARMVDERGNILSPAAFLPAIARAGLTREFDRLVIETTFDRLLADARLRERTLVCAINVTGHTMSSPDFPELLKQQLTRSGLSPRMFAIEITESESIDDLEVAKDNARKIAALGMTVAVDDFGTGLATFDYLKQFKPQLLKIDGSFIRNFDDSPLDRAIVQSIVRVAGTIGARTVAEWVETEELARKLRGLGVDFLQGYAIAKPVPIEELGAMEPQLSFLQPRANAPAEIDRRRASAAVESIPS